MDFHEKFRWDASEEANSMIAPEPWESQARRTLGFFSGLMKHFFLRPKQYKINKISKVKRWLNWEVKDLELIGKMVWWLTRWFDDWQGLTETSCQSLQHFGRQCCRPFYRFRCWSKRLHHAAGGTFLRPISLETGGNKTQK